MICISPDPRGRDEGEGEDWGVGEGLTVSLKERR